MKYRQEIQHAWGRLFSGNSEGKKSEEMGSKEVGFISVRTRIGSGLL